MSAHCSFCGAAANQAHPLVATETGTAAICLGCAQAVIDVFAEADEPVIDLTPLRREAVQRSTGEAWL